MTAMMTLDDVGPLERIKLSGQLAAQITAAATAAGMERVRIAGTIAGLLAKLGAASTPVEAHGTDAENYAARALGYSSFREYSLSRQVFGGIDKGHRTDYLTAHAKYKIVEHLQQIERSDKISLESLRLHGANPNGPEALSELRNARLVVHNARARSTPLSLAPGVTLQSFASSQEQELAGAVEPERLKNFGWDAVKLSDYSLAQLEQLRQQVEAEHANPGSSETGYTENGQRTIYLYDKKGRKKLDALGWAVTYVLQQNKAAAAEVKPADGVTRAAAGGTIGMNGEFYRGGTILPTTTLPKGSTTTTTSGSGLQLVEPGVLADPPEPGARALFAGMREFLVSDGAGLRADMTKADAIAYQFGEDGLALVRAYAQEYNAGRRWLLSGERIEPLAEDAGSSAPVAFEIIEHTTGRGKILRGIVRTDLSHADAKAIDEYTFRKDGGYFIREKHLPAMGVPATPAPAADPVDPERQAELDAEREQLRLQADADRLADQQARERKKLDRQVDKLRSVAASTLEAAEQEIGRDRLANTSRRAGMAASSIARAESARATAMTMTNLADAIERGQAVHLSGVTSRADVETLGERLRSARAIYEKANGMSYGDQERRKGAPFTAEEARYAEMPIARWDSAGASRAKVLDLIKGKRGAPALTNQIRYASEMTAEHVKMLREMLGQKVADGELGWWNLEQIAKAERLRRAGITNRQELGDALVEYLEFRTGARAEDSIAKAERAIIGQKVGIDFFPTPKALGQRMAALARIGKGDRVLEPSAGNGNLADAAKAAGAEVDVIEISSQLRDILEAKGYSVVAHDFDGFTPSEPYDSIIMNPPFGKGVARLDAQHITRAFGMLKSGGRLVAIAGEGVFIGSDAKAAAFRDWLDNHGAEVESLAQGTFKDTSLLATTGANARLIVMSK